MVSISLVDSLATLSSISWCSRRSSGPLILYRERGMEENSLHHYHLYLPRRVGLDAKSSQMLSYTYREKEREKEYLKTIEERRERERPFLPYVLNKSPICSPITDPDNNWKNEIPKNEFKNKLKLNTCAYPFSSSVLSPWLLRSRQIKSILTSDPVHIILPEREREREDYFNTDIL